MTPEERQEWFEHRLRYGRKLNRLDARIRKVTHGWTRKTLEREREVIRGVYDSIGQKLATA